MQTVSITSLQMERMSNQYMHLELPVTLPELTEVVSVCSSKCEGAVYNVSESRAETPLELFCASLPFLIPALALFLAFIISEGTRVASFFCISAGS